MNAKRNINFFQKITLLAISAITFIVYNIVIVIRIFKNKEILNRISERYGISSKKPLAGRKYVWIHAASVGEMITAFKLCKILNKNLANRYVFLITTGTKSSAELFEKKSSSFDFEVIHHFLPMDNYFLMKIFLKKWNPKICVIIESELWPNLVILASAYCKTFLVNARMSEKSFKEWVSFESLIKMMLNSFEKILTQSEQDYIYYSYFSPDNSLNFGNLKYISESEKIENENINKEYKNEKDEKIFEFLSGKKLIVAASTHEGEDEIIAKAYLKLKKELKDVFLVIIPRHIERSEKIAENFLKLRLKSSLRSKNEDINKKTDVYIADTYGEMSLFLSLKPFVIMGGSFRWYGHNILEPAEFGCIILIGPNMKNFYEISEEFIKNKAVIEINHEKEIFEKLQYALNLSDIKLQEYRNNCLKIIENKQTISENYCKFLCNYL